MLAKDVMTTTVLTVGPDTPVMEAVRLMLQNRVSGLPVVDAAGAICGIVSEGDLLRRRETDTQHQRPRWIEFLVGPGKLADEYVRQSGRLVSEVMSQPVETIDETASLSDVVSKMESRKIKRLPVLSGGKLVGIISRANVLKALVHEMHPQAVGNDQDIQNNLIAELKRQPWAPVGAITVSVRDGVVQLNGTILDERQRNAVRVAAENIPGVKKVEDHLVWIDAMSGMAIEPPGNG